MSFFALNLSPCFAVYCVLLSGVIVVSKSSHGAILSNTTAEEFERLAKVINTATNATWKADLNFIKTHPELLSSMKLGLSLTPFLEAIPQEFRMGDDPPLGDDPTSSTPTDSPTSPQPVYSTSPQPDKELLPAQFDLRKEFPQCTQIGYIKHQSNCGSCWAVASAGALADRMCIATNGGLNFPLSADEVLTCCSYCTGDGVCNGGNPLAAWDYFKRRGTTTGGDYASHQGCKPYRIAPCNYPGYPRCKVNSHPDDSLKCLKNKCSNPFFRTAFEDNLYFVRSYFKIHTFANGLSYKKRLEVQEEKIKRQIYEQGSVVVAFQTHQDFMLYQSGIYHYVAGQATEGHAVKMIGWGVEHGVPYWICVNSWGKLWGEEGTFRIRRGVDESSIETMQVSAGVFDSDRSSDLREFVYDQHDHAPVSSSSRLQGLAGIMLACLMSFVCNITMP
uniref:Cathepsin B n=1 Tax=Cacopsylla melanoneura TaxID=428564 RepID=A0A8D9FBM1_9HEMI